MNTEIQNFDFKAIRAFVRKKKPRARIYPSIYVEDAIFVGERRDDKSIYHLGPTTLLTEDVKGSHNRAYLRAFRELTNHAVAVPTK
jgi:hypothetical protein